MNKKFRLGCIIAVIVVVVLVALIIVGYVVDSRNKMARKEIEVDNSWAQVQNVYQRRLDLIPNLAEAAKAYMKLEKDIFESIADARSGINNAENPQELEAANQEVASFIRDLKVVVEDTPELKSSQTISDLMVQLEGTENRITVERQRYNESIKDYNTYIEMWPRKILAGWFGYEAKDFFEAEAGAEVAPELDLEIE